MRKKLVALVLGLCLTAPLAPAAQAAAAPVAPAATPAGAPGSTTRAVASATTAATGTPAAILATIPAVSPLRVGFKPGLFPSLTSKTKDKRGCTLRNQMLIKLATKKPRVGAGCKLSGGT